MSAALIGDVQLSSASASSSDSIYTPPSDGPLPVGGKDRALRRESASQQPLTKLDAPRASPSLHGADRNGHGRSATSSSKATSHRATGSRVKLAASTSSEAHHKSGAKHNKDRSQTQHNGKVYASSSSSAFPSEHTVTTASSPHSSPRRKSRDDHARSTHSRADAPAPAPALAPAPASESSTSYEYYSEDSGSSYNNSLFSDFSGHSDYGSSLERRQTANAFTPLDLHELEAREPADHRSSLVTTADLEVAVVKHLLVTESVKSYLLVRLEGLRESMQVLESQRRAKYESPLERVAEAQRRAAARTDLPSSTTLLGATRDEWLSPHAYSSTELASIARQTDGVWQQHLDAFVERYLTDPIYHAALAQFRKHQSPAHQYLRLSDYKESRDVATSQTEQYRLSQIVARVLQGDTEAAVLANGHPEDVQGTLSHSPIYSNIDAAGGADHEAAHPPRAEGSSGAGGEAHASASREHYCVRRWDVELLGTDAARRIRFKDDTLPWRPVHFDSTAIRLEPIELASAMAPPDSERKHAHSLLEAYGRHPSSPGHSVAEMSAVSNGGPLVGGSINLLVEVLILTELDVPFTAGVPRVNFTNVFMITASLFVLPDVLISKFIRLFRSIYYWQRYETFVGTNSNAGKSEGNTNITADDKIRRAGASRAQRASFLHRRILQCMLAYCRCHEMDLTMRVLQRIALFVEKCGFPSPLAKVDTNTHSWAVSRGVLDGITLSRASAANAAPSSPAPVAGGGGPSYGTGVNTGEGGGGRSVGGREGPAADKKDFRALALLSSTGLPHGALTTHIDATRLPREAFDDDVTNGFLELSIYVQSFAARHYRAFSAGSTDANRSPTLSTAATASASLPPAAATMPTVPSATGSLCSAMKGSPPPHHEATLSQRLREAGTVPSSGGGRRHPSPAASGPTFAPGVFASSGTSASPTPARALASRPLVYLDRGAPRRHLGSTYVSNRYSPSPLTAGAARIQTLPQPRSYFGVDSSAFSAGEQTGIDEQHGGAVGRHGHMYRAGAAVPIPEEFFWVLRRHSSASVDLGGAAGVAFRQRCLERPAFRPTMVHAETFAQQLSVLSFSLFSRIRVRELLNNAWQKTDMRDSVAVHLNEMIHYRHQLSLWTAALITAPREWDDCQRAFRHLLEVCRRLYDQQNYEMAAAVLEGLQHEAVGRLATLFKDSHEEPILTSAEQRELETLTELMNPYAAYSPSSLNSVAARTAGDMDSAIIPLLAPILAVLSRAQESLSGNPAVLVREFDGQAIIVWTRVMAIGKMVNLWLRCQVTPFPFRPVPALQEYLWSLVNHQWTGEVLLRVARREKH